MDTPPEDDISALEKARQRLYRPISDGPKDTASNVFAKVVPHAWRETILPSSLEGGDRHVRLATLFFVVALLFFLFAIGIAGISLYMGGNSVSVDKISIDVQGPNAITGGDTVPLSFTITNRNPVAIQNATLEIVFPNGTRDATDISKPYQHYLENLGTIESGATVTRSVKAVLFGATGQSVSLPIVFSFASPGSSAVLQKKTNYSLTVTATPLEVSVDTLTETVSNQPITLTVAVRSNATVPINNVVLGASFPFGFSLVASSLPINNSTMALGTMAPGGSKTVTITGTLTGQNTEERVFHFTVGTADTVNPQAIAVSYMTQDATVRIAAPFIDTTLAINGKTENNVALAPGASQNVSISYTNTLAMNIDNARVEVGISGSAIDYNSIQSSSGFYNSATHTILFSKDTDPSLQTLAPGASGVGAFTFTTLPSGSAGSPNVNFSVSVSGTRVGQSNVPENISATMTRTAKVVTTIAFSAASSRTNGGFPQSGSIPPRANQATTYSILWTTQNKGSAVAGGTVTATLPSYVTYTGLSSGTGSISYNKDSRTITWDAGDLAQGATAQTAFQVSLTPSTSQKGGAPALTSTASFTGYDRFAGVPITLSADPVTTETKNDPGYVSSNAVVQ